MVNCSIKQTNLAEFIALFGPPPVLRTESRENFEELLDQVMACLKPQDVIEAMLTRDFVYASWLIARYSQHQTVSVERRFLQSLEFQAQRAKVQKARKEALLKDQVAKSADRPADIAGLVHLENIAESVVTDIDEILERTPTELEHNRALEKDILFIEQLDVLLSRARSWRNDSLKLLEHYRKGSEQLLSKVTAQVLDAEFEEVEGQLDQAVAPQLAPSDEGIHELGTQDSSEPQQ
jgi:hypothetical protein